MRAILRVVTESHVYVMVEYTFHQSIAYTEGQSFHYN